MERKSQSGHLGYFKEALHFRLERVNRSRYENDRYPIGVFGRMVFILKSLRPEEAKELIKEYASFCWGKNILSQTFPRDENPEDFNSRGGVVSLSDGPVQVLGWDDYERLKKEGVNDLGLDEDYIMYGFEAEAERRGIDLEWSFHHNPPGMRGHSSKNPSIESGK